MHRRGLLALVAGGVGLLAGCGGRSRRDRAATPGTTRGTDGTGTPAETTATTSPEPYDPGGPTPSMFNVDARGATEGSVEVVVRVPEGTATFVVVERAGEVIGHSDLRTPTGADLTVVEFDVESVPPGALLRISLYADVDGSRTFGPGDRPFDPAASDGPVTVTVRAGERQS